MTDNSITNADIITMTMKALDIVSKALDLLAADSQPVPAATEEVTSEQDAMPLGKCDREVVDREVTPWDTGYREVVDRDATPPDTGDEEMTACGSFKLQTPPLPLPLKGGECLRCPLRQTTRQPLPLKGGECLRSPLRQTRRQPLPSLVGEGLGVGSVIKPHEILKNRRRKGRAVPSFTVSLINSPPAEQNFSPFSFAMSENVTNFAELFER